MEALIIGALAAVAVATLLRSRLGGFALVLVSGAIGLVWVELAARLTSSNALFFREVNGLVVMSLAVALLVLGVVGMICAGLVHRLVPGKPTAAADDVPVLTKPEWWGVQLVAIGCICIAGPFFSSDRYGSAPLATVLWFPCLLSVSAMMGWLVSRLHALRWMGTAWAVFAVFVACTELVQIPTGPGEAPLHAFLGWPHAAAMAGLVVATLGDHHVRMKTRIRNVPGPAREWPLIVPAILSVAVVAVLVVGGYVVAIQVSPEGRAAMHPSFRAACADWALDAWSRRDSQEAFRLEEILRARVVAKPAAFLAQAPAMLADPDPAIRYAAAEALDWIDADGPPGTMAMLLSDAEPRFRDAAFAHCLRCKSDPPDDATLVAAISRDYAQESGVSLQSLADWLGQDHAERVEAAILMAAPDARVRDNFLRDLEDGGPALEAIAAIILADPDPRRRETVFALFSPDRHWNPSPAVTTRLAAMSDQPGAAGDQAARVLETLDVWACEAGRRGDQGPAPVRLPVDLRMRLHLRVLSMDADPNDNGLRREDPAMVEDAVVKALQSSDPERCEEGLRAARVFWDIRPDPAQDGDFYRALLAIMRGRDSDRARRAATLAFGERGRGPEAEAVRVAILNDDPATVDAAVRAMANCTEANYQVCRSSYFIRCAASTDALWDPTVAKRQQAGARMVQAIDDPDRALDGIDDRDYCSQRPLADTQEAHDAIAGLDPDEVRQRHLARIAAALAAARDRFAGRSAGDADNARRNQALAAAGSAPLSATGAAPSTGELRYAGKRLALSQAAAQAADTRKDPEALKMAAALADAGKAVADRDPLMGDIALMQAKYCAFAPPQPIGEAIARPLLYWCWDRLLEGDKEPLACARKDYHDAAVVLSGPIRNAENHLERMVNGGPMPADADGCLWVLAQILDPMDGTLRMYSDYIDYIGAHQDALKAAQQARADAAAKQRQADADFDRDHADGAALSPWASARGSDEHGRWADLTVGAAAGGPAGMTQRFRLIRPGTFTMGSTWVDDWEQETAHAVTLTRAFWMADSPCTAGQWAEIMGGDPGRQAAPEDLLPVVDVSQDDANRFVAALNARVPGAPARLPTEAEWEYACRAGTLTAWNGPDLDAIAWYGGNAGGTLHPVRTKAANAWGLFDMHGEVRQWCSDRWENRESSEPSTDPTGPAAGPDQGECVVRGGDYCDDEYWVRSAIRRSQDSHRHDNRLGFRLVMAISP